MSWVKSGKGGPLPVLERVAGRIPVIESLRAGRRKAHRLFLLRDARDLGPVRTAAAELPITECSRAELDRLAKGVVHQGAVLEADPLPVFDVHEWQAQPFPDDAIVVVLDGVEDPHNFGAIVRSAVACGVRGIVFGMDRAAPISTAAVKAAAGAMEYVDLVQAANLVRSIEALKRAGFWTAALEATASQTLWDADLTGKTALVIGSEGKGIRRLVRERCDMRLRIPLVGAIRTLNASVSAAIALVECIRQKSNRP
ncbi:MAG: 23S rRNA (guanosine(2251)-2'-O)-methyltransferase RlmB [Candidatus Hydrogenedentes bacterium]|nr:23S rRNA (guanosine(2251)-2'-O)-methyltransferase RlmB [Candidatus Hydrogenedentota bacterium]